jgi:uncharacterized protein YbaP (TraB family)
MFRQYFNVICAFLVLISLFSCKSTKQVADTKQNSDIVVSDGKSLLWKITSPQQETPSYLFGTIHLIGTEDFFFGTHIENLIKNASKVVLELDVTNIDIAALTNQGLLPDNKTVKDFISEEDYQILLNFMVDSVGIGKSSFESAYARMKPLFLEQMLVYKFLGDNPQSYESEIIDMIEFKGTPIEGLETFNEQLDFINQIPLERQFADLMESMKDFGKTRKDFSELLDLYKDQDIEKLSDAINKEFKDDTTYQHLLLNKRNDNWIPKIEDYISEGNVFIAVGAGHLTGENGLIELLKKKGYKLEPIYMD